MTDQPFQLPEDDLACVEEVEIITDYLEGALPPEETRRLEEHIAICPGCTEYIAQMRTLAGELGGLRAEQLSPDLRRGLIESFRDFRRN